MRLSLWFVGMVLCTFWSYALCGETLSNVEKGSGESILFIGNSLTYTNDLPKVMEAYVAQAYPDVKLQTKAIAKPGWTLDQHKADGTALVALRARSWNYVVLQGGRGDTSGGTIDGRRFFVRPTSFLEAVAFFADQVKAQSGVPILFGGWGGGGAESARYSEQAYELAVHQTKSVLAPVGFVSDRLRSATGIKLIGPDGIHPTKQGTVLAAVVLAKVMFGEPTQPSKVAASEFSPQDLALIRSALGEVHEMQSIKHAAVDLPYGSPPPLLAEQPLDLAAKTAWCAKNSGFRYSVGAKLVTTKDQTLRLVNFAPGARLQLPMEKLKMGGNRIEFDTTTGGVEYHVSIVRVGNRLRMLTSYRSNATDQIFQHADYEENCNDGYFARLTSLYDRMEADSIQVGLAKALGSHYKRLKMLLGQQGMKDATAGFGLNEWDAIMISWVYNEIGNHDAELRYLAAATKMFPDSVDAKLYRADALSELGHSGRAKKVLQAALELDGAKDARVRKNIEEKLKKLSR